MIFITTYTLKPNITKAETKELMGVFATVGNTPGTQAHYVNADGGGGIVIAESDDPAEGYANLLNYTQWMEFETKVMLKVEDAIPLIGAYLVLGASHEVLVCKRAQSMLARTRCALTPQTQNLRRSSQRFPCNIGLTAWHA
jgi:hypothetical protein